MEAKTVEKHRNPRIDALKGVLILLVILGHCIGHDPSYRINMTSYNYIYLFHMPLFVFMSGYFTHIVEGDSKSFWYRVLQFAYIYVFWQIIKSLYLSRSLFSIIVLPAPMMWYLFSLIFWCLVLWLSRKISKRITPVFLTFISIAVALAAGFLPWIGAQFALSRTLVFAPFFFMGVALQKKDFIEFCDKLPCWMAWLILTTVFVVLYIVNINISFIVRGVIPYPADCQLIGLVGRMAYYIVAVVMSCAIIRIVLPNKLMSIIGLDTMKYYIFHGVILMVLYSLPIPWSFGYAIVYWVLISVVLFLFNKWRVSDVILNPIGKIVRRLKK